MIKDSEKALPIPKEHKFLHDCAVLAHAIAFDKDYLTAKKEVLGLGLDNYWLKYAKTFPIKDVRVFNNRYTPEGKTYTEEKPLGKKITTVRQFFNKVKDNEVWIVGVRSHVFTIKNGIIYDRKRYYEDNSGWRRKVNVAYRIK